MLLPAIAEVNSQGDFRISLKQEKVGRSITHFQILIKKKLKTEKTKEKKLTQAVTQTQPIYSLK